MHFSSCKITSQFSFFNHNCSKLTHKSLGVIMLLIIIVLQEPGILIYPGFAVCFLILRLIWEEGREKCGTAPSLPSNPCPCRAAKAFVKSYATEIILQPADPPLCAWKCCTDGAVLSTGITHWGRMAMYKNPVSV